MSSRLSRVILKGVAPTIALDVHLKDRALDELRPGDTLVVWKLDRLGRSLRYLLDVAKSLRERGVGLRSLTEHLDTAAAAGAHILAGSRG